jgi:hypothetical protein
MFLCSQNHLLIMVGKRSSISMLHIIIVVLQYHFHCLLLHHHSIQMPKFITLFCLPSPHMQAKCSKSPCSNQRLIKVKKWPIPLTLPKIPLNLCSPIFTSKTIVSMSSTKSILKVPIRAMLQQKDKQQKDQKSIVVKRGKPPLIANMDFDVVIGMAKNWFFFTASIYLDKMFWTAWMLSYFWSTVMFYFS